MLGKNFINKITAKIGSKLLVTLGATAVVTTLLVVSKADNQPTITEDTTIEPVIAEAQVTKKNKRFVKALFPSKEIKSKKFKIKTKKGGVIEYKKTGTKITVPANAFLDKNGELVKGKVEIEYREFHNPFETLASGIPMAYDSGSAEHQLESAGMIEIYAHQDGKEVFTNPENLINIDLASNNEEDNFSLYFFDKEEGTWDYQGKNDVVVETTVDTVPVFEDASSLSNSSSAFSYLADTSKLPKRFGVRNFKNYQPTLNLDESATPFSKRFCFSITDYQRQLPAMCAFDSMVWVYDRSIQKDDTKFFETLLMSDFAGGNYVYRYWDFINLTHTAPNDFLTMKFIKKDKADINVNIYPSCDPGYEGLDAFKTIKRFKAAEDSLKRINQESMLALRNRRILQVKKQRSITRSFEVAGFGIWNCDRRVRFRSFKSFKPSYADLDGNKIRAINVSYIHKGLNSVYCFSGYQPIRISSLGNGMLIANLPDDHIGYITPNELKEILSDSTNTDVTFKFNISTEVDGTLEKLKKMYKI